MAAFFANGLATGLRGGAAVTGIPFISPISSLLFLAVNMRDASVRPTRSVVTCLTSTLTGDEAVPGRLGGGHGQTRQNHFPVEQPRQLVRTA